MTQKLSQWLQYVHKLMGQKSAGSFTAEDKHGVPVILQWEKATIKEPAYSKNMHEVCDVACRAYTDVEVAFLKKFPQVVEREDYYKQFRSLFQDGIEHVNWELVEKQMYTQIKQIHQMNCSQFSAQDIYFFVKIRDKKTKELLGFTIFLIKPEYPEKSMKDISIGLIPQVQGRGLGKLLISSIFNIIPKVERIFLYTRVTNDRAIGAYKAWGFTPDLNPLQDSNFTFKKEHWVSLEYKVQNSDILQKVAKEFLQNKQ